MRSHPVENFVEMLVACVTLQLTKRTAAGIGAGDCCADFGFERLRIGGAAAFGDVAGDRRLDWPAEALGPANLGEKGLLSYAEGIAAGVRFLGAGLGMISTT